MMKVVAVRALAPVGLTVMGVGWLATASMRGPARAKPPVIKLAPTRPLDSTITVMSLNAAHGRAAGRHQLLTNNAIIGANLDQIAALIEREGADVVGLQEADGPSAWSGRYDHVEHIAQRANMAHAVRGEHMRGAGLVYGTAVMSRGALFDPLSVTFRPNPPTPAKGFVLTTVAHPDSPSGGIDVVSVHLDFARARVRRRQIARILSTLADRPHPRIVMGDFNASWGERGTLPALIRGLGAVQVAPDADAPPTFPGMGGRLDWIVVSPELEILDSRVLPDVVSDHRAVVAQVKVRADGERAVDPRIATMPPPRKRRRSAAK